MYKIHINASRIILIKSALSASIQQGDKIIIAKYNGKPNSLLNYIDKAEKTPDAYIIYLHAKNVVTLKDDFFSLYRLIKAGGGLVLNQKAEVLMIFRRGLWDLPKGKKEKGEKRKETALREVKEETGLKELDIISALPDTYHTYKINGQRKMKLSYWYLMETTDIDLIPETEEDIEIAEWVSLDRIAAGEMTPVFGSIGGLLKYYVQNY